MNYFATSGKLTAQPGQGTILQGYLQTAARRMEAIETCLCYIVGISTDEPDAVYIYEVWENENAHQASLELPVFQELIAQAKPIIAGMENFPDLTIIGGKAKL